MNYTPVLTIAGSDSCGGAGVQADIKTLSALGCYAASAITSITVQNTLGVTAVQAVRPDIVAGQIRAVMDDICPRAIKIGMVNDAATIRAIADTLSLYGGVAVVVDPVMVATSGSRLMEEEAVGVFRERLLPLATLLTPNLPEAEVLAGMPISSPSDCDEAARRMATEAKGSLLIKGGHSDGAQKEDRLYDSHGRLLRAYTSPTVATRNTHGTGCTLSSAIAAHLALGLPMEEAVAQAKAYVTAALKAGTDVEIGQGHGPVNHFFDPKKLVKA